MTESRSAAEAAGEAVAEMEALPGVQRAFYDDERRCVILLARGGAPEPCEAAARAILARVAGAHAREIEVRVAYPHAPEPKRRVRFVGARITAPCVGRARAEVELEWAGESITAMSEGESGAASELRLCAQATLRALQAALHGALEFQLLGVKATRAFDTDLLVAMVHARERPGEALVGAALALDGAPRAAALAVLNATNRILGNYLANSDEV